MGCCIRKDLYSIEVIVPPKNRVQYLHSVCADSHLLSPIEVELDVEVFNEGGDGVPVGVGLFLDDPDQVFHDLVPPGGLVDDDGGGKVSQDPRAGRLDGVEVLPLVQE